MASWKCINRTDSTIYNFCFGGVLTALYYTISYPCAAITCSGIPISAVIYAPCRSWRHLSNGATAHVHRPQVIAERPPDTDQVCGGHGEVNTNRVVCFHSPIITSFVLWTHLNWNYMLSVILSQYIGFLKRHYKCAFLIRWCRPHIQHISHTEPRI